MNIYDLLEIKWNEEFLLARPTAWSEDITADDFNFDELDEVFVIQYELTCPKCGAMCLFNADSLKIMCDECEAFVDNPLINKDLIDEEIIDGVIINEEDMVINRDLDKIIQKEKEKEKKEEKENKIINEILVNGKDKKKKTIISGKEKEKELINNKDKVKIPDDVFESIFGSQEIL